MVSFVRLNDNYSLGYVEDITDRKKQEMEYKQLIDGMNDTAFVIGFDLRFLEVNEAAVRTLGYTREELLGMGPVDIDAHLNPEDIGKLREGMRLDAKQVFETRHQTKDGRLIPVEISSSRVSYQGKGAILSVARDMTERRREEEERERLQAQLVQAQKMESVGRLAGGVAHDFNNMLGVVLGYTEIALQKTPPGDPLAGYLKEVLKAARRSRDITRQLLAFARQQTVAPEVLDLNTSVEGMLKMLRRLLGEDILLEWHPGPDLWPVLIDPSQVDQILAKVS